MQPKHSCLGVCHDIGTATRRVKSLAAFVDRLYGDEACCYFFFLRSGQHL